MTAELVRGQNHPVPRVPLEVRVSAGTPVVVGATLGDEQGTVPGAEWFAHPGAPTLPGLEVSRQAAAEHRLAVDLGALPEAVHRVSVLLALPAPGSGGPVCFGAVAAPFVAVTGPDGAALASYTITGLDAESAVVALEFYRRQGGWKVRAVGQGYATGLAALLTDQGLSEAHQLANSVDQAVAQGLARSRSVPAPPPVPEDADLSRRPAAPALGGDQGGPTTPGGTGAAPPPPTPGIPLSPGAGPTRQPTPPHGIQDPPPAAGDPYRPQDDPRPGISPHATSPYGTPGGAPTGTSSSGHPRRPDSADPSAVAQPSGTPGTGGAIDYRHPRRRNAAPPPPPTEPPTEPPTQPGQPAPPFAGDATGWSMEERLYNQVWGMFEDLARTTAAYRSAVDFADSRRDKEFDQALADPRSRIGGQGDAARDAARVKHARLVEQARAVFDRDLGRLLAESEVVEPALPPAYARWDNPVWHGYRVPTEMPMALRMGDLHLPEAVELRIPLLVRLPLERGLWIDSGGRALDGAFTDSHDLRHLAMETAVAHAARLLAAHPAGEFTVQVIDPAGSGTRPLTPLVRAGVLAGPPGAGAAGVADVLTRLTQRVDLLQMAVRGGAADALPPDFDTSQQLLIVNDFPHGFDDGAVNQLRYLTDEGPAVGVHLMMVADRAEAAAYGPLLDPLWRSLMRLTALPDDHLADPWVGHAWTYEPALPPPGGEVLEQVLSQVATARTKYS